MRKLIFIGVVLLVLIISLNLVRSTYELYRKQDLVTKAQESLRKEKEDNKSLKQSLESAKSKAFIEEEARNKLFLVKEGEQKAIIPKEELLNEKNKAQNVDNRPNYQKWLSLFF